MGRCLRRQRPQERVTAVFSEFRNRETAVTQKDANCTMQKQKPIIDQSLSELADERDAVALGRSAAAVAGWAVNGGLVISAVLTVIYLMLLVDDATGLPDPYGLLFGLLVGIVAIVPAELALVIWRARLAADGAITTGQRVTAVTAMIAAGVFSALTTSSFFSYFLPQLFSPAYLAIAPALNVGAIVGSWVTFILAVVAYSVFSRQTQQNLSQAKAYQSIFDARMVVLRSASEAIHLEAENLVKDMNDRGVFRDDAQQLILASLGMDANRLTLPGRAASPPPQERDYRVQVNTDGQWQTVVSYPEQWHALKVADSRRNEANEYTRVLTADGTVIAEYLPDDEETWQAVNEREQLDAARDRLVANGNGAGNPTQRPGNGRGL